jgi:hypothetical protein
VNNCGDSIRVVHPLFQEEDDGSIPISPLQLHIGKISARQAVELNKLWHSRMPKLDCFNICAPCFAAEYKNKFYAIAMWSLPIAANRLKDGQFCLELRRMAISDDAPKNTASRMISIMARIIKKERPDIKRLLSYQDTGAHSGIIYAASGWKPVLKSDFVSWDSHSKRPGKIDQSESPKIRWERSL